MESKTHTAVIADDHDMLRSGIRTIFTGLGSIEVVAEVSDGLAAIAAAKRHKPDLMTLDIAMPYAQGIAVFTEVRRWSPETRVIVFSGVTSSSLLVELRDAGVDGIFTKRGDTSEIEKAVPLILEGTRVISADACALMQESALPDKLSQREKQVLSLIAGGHTTKSIAEHLCISAKTVEKHRASIMSKLQVRSIAELLAYALREGLLDPQSQL